MGRQDEYKTIDDVDARVVEVIEVQRVIGAGSTSDPMRNLREYFSFDGEFLGRIDPYEADDAQEN